MEEKKYFVDGVEPERYPNHIAFIMDGNGRWAKKRLMPRTYGHTMGALNFKKIVVRCRNLGIKYITFYVFSTENWSRPQMEVKAIIKLLDQYMDEVREFFYQKTRLIFIGRRDNIAPELLEKMEKLEEDTKDFDKMTMLLAFNYGSRDEITHAAKEIAKKVQNGEMNIDDISENTVNDNLYTKNIPDVDLLIRPSGEYRISNFLLWQSAYAEMYFTNAFWPDFDEKELDKAIQAYSKRNRRFGGI